MNPPAMFKVNGDDRRFESWEQEMKSKLNPKVTFVVFLLFGNKNGAPMYDPIKKCLLKIMPVPSQVVLHNTVARGKNLRSIVNKILIQMNAKLGGEPWCVSNQPESFASKPTMVCGYDVFHKAKSNSYLAFCGTVNRSFNRYWSSYIQQREYQEIAEQLQNVMSEALDGFKKLNGIYPKQLVFYRDGVGE